MSTRTRTLVDKQVPLGIRARDGENIRFSELVVVVGFYWLWLLPYSQVYFKQDLS
jgi:hypothetical protein